ncbi:unnamed protein product, partial [Mesorhabditis belari]|uniref:TNFR-Cys domain-containing protein n=1 Tax=Mesorhabditis belari TaxID=2138241 RepID=A0AAF3ES77_9BILA
MNFWSFASIFFIQIALANAFGFRQRDSDEDYNYCKNNTYLDTRFDGAFRCRPCSICPSGQYEQSPCRKDKNTSCGYCHDFGIIQNDDWRKKCLETTTPPPTPNYKRYCGYGMWYKQTWDACLQCSKCNWDEYESLPCSNNRDTTCEKCFGNVYWKNSDWQRKCRGVVATSPSYNWHQLYEDSYSVYENRTYNCSTPFENFELTGLISCYFSTLVQWTFIVSLIILSCCCLTAYKICTSCFRRERSLQQQIDKVRLLSPDELQVLQQATQMIKEQKEKKAKENNFENPNFQETV